MDTLLRADSSREIQPRIKAIGYAAKHCFSHLKPLEFERPGVGDREVQIQVLYCGVCHSDLQQVRNEWHNTIYPCMPGHEVVGRVVRVGNAVTRHKIGDLVGVGCMIDSCGECGPCRAGAENYCESANGWLGTYNGPTVPAEEAPGHANIYGRDNTFGGYSNVLVVKEHFVLKIPTALDPDAAAPLLCAGVTTYSPLKRWGVKPGHCVGIVGFGGLGNIGAKLAKAMGAHVTIFTRSRDKREEATQLGFSAILEDDEQAFHAAASSFDFMLSTIPGSHDLNPYIRLLKRDSTICVVGCLEPLERVDNMEVATHRKEVAGSLIGSIGETQEVLQFCAQHDIAPDIQVIRIDELNDAYRKVEKGDVRYRFVIDMSSLQSAA
ncbi:MAG TPA: NAD(P)-dependent alcohol dehydrogenase [Steroidobacteraceae bacterium]|nr:NAD(P)-dependent alcohol dehydrogenase [Steroidobacteraceae bacterium]